MNEFFRTDSEPVDILASLVVAFIIGIGIALTYKRTHKSISYSQAFVSSLVVFLPIATLIIYFVSNNIARAIGVFGAFSIVRFRTAVKESKDMVYIFWVLAMSLVIGAGSFITAVLSSVLISSMFFILYYFDFGSIREHDFLLVYSLDTSKERNEVVLKLLKQMVFSMEIVNIKSRKDKKKIEISMNVNLRRGVMSSELVTRLEKVKGIGDINMMPSKQNIEF